MITAGGDPGRMSVNARDTSTFAFYRKEVIEGRREKTGR